VGNQIVNVVGQGFGCLFMAVVALFALAQLLAGYTGIQHHLGTVAALIALFLAFYARFTLPLTVGAFFGAWNVWGWHWFWALVFAAPGVVFVVLMFPGVLLASVPWMRKT
jgi:MFS family permease